MKTKSIFTKRAKFYAIADFETYLDLVPDATNREGILALIEDLKEQLGE